MATPLPPKETTNRELLGLARRIERYGAQRRKLLKRVEELDGQIREAKRMFRALTDLIAGPVVTPLPDDLSRCFCGFDQDGHGFGGPSCTASERVPRC